MALDPWWCASGTLAQHSYKAWPMVHAYLVLTCTSDDLAGPADSTRRACELGALAQRPCVHLAISWGLRVLAMEHAHPVLSPSTLTCTQRYRRAFGFWLRKVHIRCHQMALSCGLYLQACTMRTPSAFSWWMPAHFAQVAIVDMNH